MVIACAGGCGSVGESRRGGGGGGIGRSIGRGSL